MHNKHEPHGGKHRSHGPAQPGKACQRGAAGNFGRGVHDTIKKRHAANYQLYKKNGNHKIYERVLVRASVPGGALDATAFAGRCGWPLLRV